MVVYIYRMNVKDKFYVGSTKNIKNRINKHKSNCYNQNVKDYNMKVYKYIRENCADLSEISFSILDVYDDISKEFRKDIEQYYIDYFSNNLNSYSANFSKERKAEKVRLRYRNDEEYRNNYKKRKSEKIICECGKVVSFGYIGQHRKSKIHQKLLNK